MEDVEKAGLPSRVGKMENVFAEREMINTSK
jgi:hypothetical protein